MAVDFLMTAASHGTVKLCGEFKSKGTAVLNIPPRPATVCYSHPGTPAHTLRCGFLALTGTQ